MNSAPAPARAAVARFAKVVHASPSKSRHRFASSFGGGIELVPSLLSIFFRFDFQICEIRKVSNQHDVGIIILVIVCLSTGKS